MADEVGELEGAHAKPAGIAQQCIERGAVGRAFLQQAQAFGIERPGHAVDNEAWCGTGLHGLLAPGLGGFIKLRGNGWRGGQPADDFHQGHQRGWVEEMHAHHLLRPLQARGQARDRQRRGIAGQNAVWGAERFELQQQGLLDLQVLDDGLDDQAGIGEGLDRLHWLQACSDSLASLGLQPAFFHQAPELTVDARHGLCRCTGAVVVELDRVPGLGRHLGDTGAHGTRADHCHQRVVIQCAHVSAP